MAKISASILSSDFGKLNDEVQAVAEAGTDWIHVDVMDGHFVPNISIGLKAVEAIRNATDLPLDVHLMIEQPERYLENFARAGADWLGVHVEAATHLHRIIQQIKELGVKASAALNPATPLSAIENVLTDVDMVLIMTVNPGFGGQRFIHTLLPKVRHCRKMINEGGRPVLLQVDGGVHENTIAALAQAGVDVFVAGSAIFGDGDYAESITRLKAHMKP